MARYLVAIGALLGVAQGSTAQEGSIAGGAVGWIGTRDERFRERFRQVLLAVPTRDLPAGWQLAADLGRPAVPLLWDMMLAEGSNVGRRLVMLTASVVAGGASEDERLFAWLDRQRPMLEERVLASMLWALGPRHPRPVNDFWARVIGPTKSPDQILAIAVRLAAVRFPAQEGSVPPLQDDDAGLAAASAYAGGEVPTSVATRLWNLRTPERHAELFWRGALLAGARKLGEGGTVSDALLTRARELMLLPGDQHASVRAAAALLRARARDLGSDGSRPDWRLLEVMASDIAGARAVAAWLGPLAQPRNDEPQRLAVAYVLSREPADVVADHAIWSADARIARHVAVALAWRVLGEASPRPIELRLTGTPEWVFVRWAAGQTIEVPPEVDDPQLRVAAGLAAAGRIARDAMRTTLEDALWRWGSHPSLSAWEEERLLVRDLLLVGSHPGGSKYVPHLRPEQRYRPTGIGPDDTFFEIAVAVFDFLASPRGPMPSDLRLR